MQLTLAAVRPAGVQMFHRDWGGIGHDHLWVRLLAHQQCPNPRNYDELADDDQKKGLLLHTEDVQLIAFSTTFFWPILNRCLALSLTASANRSNS